MTTDTMRRSRVLALNSLFVFSLLFAVINVSATEKVQSHLDGEKKLGLLLKSNPEIDEAMKNMRLDRVNALTVAFETQLGLIRKDFDLALFTGKWQDTHTKRKAQKIIGRLESANTLCMIARAFSSDYYKYPDNYIPASVADALSKMFIQIASLHHDVKKLNQNI